MRRSFRRRPAPPLRCLLPLLAGALACADAGGTNLDDAPLLAAAADLRIGSLDDPATMLTRVGRIAVDDAGRIYASQPQDHVVLVHDATGARVAELGGEGEGPGEFRSVVRIGLVGDTLWAMDHRLYRITWFSPPGKMLRSLRIPIELGGDGASSPPRPAGLLHDGRVYGSPPAWSREIASGELTEVPVVVMDTTGAVGDTLFHRPFTVWHVSDWTGGRGFGSYRSQPWPDQPLVEMAATGPWYVVVEREVRPDDAAPAFRVARVGFDGDTAFVREFPYEPVPIDPAAPDSLVNDWAERWRERPLGGLSVGQAAELARASLYVPAHHPPVSALVVGRDGTIWLRRERADPDTTEWLVLDDTGDPFGRVRLPAAFDPHVATRDRVWGAETDELDVPYIVRYAVLPEERG